VAPTPVNKANPRTLAAFASRDFRLLWGGQTISFIGDAAFTVALGWRVLDLTRSAGSLGYVLALQSLGTVTTLLLGGVLADRYSRRWLMICSDLARAVVVGVFLAIEVSGHLTFPAVLGLAVCFGLGSGFFQPAFSGIVPLVVETPMLASANSWLNIARQVSAVAGPAIAAGLYGSAGPSTVWAIEAGSFLVSAAAVWLARPRTTATEAPRGVDRELAEGFRYVISVPWLWAATAASTLCLMIAMAPFTALLPRIVRTHYGRGVGSYGLLFSLMAAGMVVGSLAWARWHPQRGRVPLCFSSFGVAYLGIVVVAVSPWYPLAAAAVIWRGFWIGVGTSAWLTMVIEQVPERLLSRVFSFDFFGSSGLTPVGYVIAASLATTVAPTTILAVGGSLAVALWLAPLGWRRVRIIA
jgi:MFS family permease